MEGEDGRRESAAGGPSRDRHRRRRREVAPYGINVNAICRGPTLTPMYERNSDEETRRERIAMVPKGCWITPADHGGVAVFLCSEAADALCGLAIDVDGGSLLGWMPWERYMAKRKRP